MRRVYRAGRALLGWIALLAALVAVAALVSGLFFPPGLRAVEKVICPAGMTVQASGDNLDASRRSSTAERYSQYCSSTNPSRMKDMTARWVMFIVGLLVSSGLSLFLRARLTPPRLRAPEA